MKHRLCRAFALAGVFTTAGLLTGVAPASADDVCAIVRVYVDGSAQPVGGCVTVTSWPKACANTSPDLVMWPTGLGFQVCVPDPPV